MNTRKIQLKDLKPGMKIKTLDESGNVVFKEVTDVWKTEVPQHNQRELVFQNGVSLSCSKNHPIMTTHREQMLPDKLIEEDSVQTDSARPTNLLHRSVGFNDTRYIDITVDGTHTFFASSKQDGPMVLTHNSQGGVRGGAATVYYPIWHYEAEDLFVLKNNKGTESNRVRHMDYGVQINGLFYKRLINGEDITLFSPHEVPGLYDAFFSNQEEFERLYLQYEADPSIRKKVVSAADHFESLIQERQQTGRIYIMNVDNVNEHSSFDPMSAPVRMSNLCLTGDTPVDISVNGMFHTAKLEDLSRMAIASEDIKIRGMDRNGNSLYVTLTDFAKTGEVKELIEIEENGHIIRCTPDHEIATQNRGYVMAKDLKEEDELIFEK